MAESFPSLEAAWRAALFFESKGPSAGVQFLAQEDRVQLRALKDQALSGPIGEAMSNPPQFEDNVRRVQREAWKALGAMPREEAKRQFMHRLSAHFPHWPQWYTDHGQEHAAQVSQEQSLTSQSQTQLHPHAQSHVDLVTQSKSHNTQGWMSGREVPQQTGRALGEGMEGAKGGDSLSEKLLREFQKKTGLVLPQKSRL